MLPEEFLDVLEAESFKMVGDYSNEVTKKAKNATMQAIKQGVSENELAKILMEECGNMTEKWANTVARTKTTEIYNQARKTCWDTDPLASQIIEAYQFSAIMDERTSDVCSKLDGKIFEKGDFTSVITPPLHHNCFLPGTKIRGKGKKLWMDIEKINIGDLVLTQSREFYPVIELHKNEYSGDIIVIELENGKIIKATPNHPIFTVNRGWVNAGDISETDIFDMCEMDNHDVLRSRYSKWLESQRKNLEDLYINKKLSLRKIATTYKTYSPQIGYWLKRLGISLRHGSEAVQTQWINNNSRREKASKTLKKIRAKYPNPRMGKKDPGQSARMKSNNPMYMPGVKEKAAKAKIDHGISFSGNKNPMYGKSPIHPDIINYKGMRLRSTYELKFVKYMESNGIKFDYEPKRFDLGFCTYTPDFFIYNNDGSLEKVVEIKGWVKEKDLNKVKALKEIMIKDGVDVVMYSKPELVEMGVL
jgi:SPP1 gp7 family putative phage head morphogenesis protein